MNKVTVKIANHEYTIVGEEKKEYLLQLAAHVDEKIESTSKANPKLSQTMTAVLTAINIADEYYSQLNENSELRKNLNKPLEELEKASKYIKDLERTISEKESQIDKINQKIQSYEDSLNLTNNSKNDVVKKMEEKDLKLKEAENLVDDFQNRLYDMQIKIIELEEKLENKE